jgi:hypothetical protein
MLRKQGRIQVTDLLLNPLTLLYDIRLSDKGIQFILFRFLVIATVPYENIEGVGLGEKIFKQWAAYRFVNRWVAPRYVINKKKAWFAKEVVISPRNGSDFIERLKQHGVRVAAN